jgi:hypothetical protein
MTYLTDRLLAAKALADAEAAVRDATESVAALDAHDPAFLDADKAAEDMTALLDRAARDLRCAMAVLNNTTLGQGAGS